MLLKTCKKEVLLLNQQLRPPAVPLVTVDPYFSIWSFSDQLYGDVTRHWTGNRNNLVGLISVDGVRYKFMGMADNTRLTSFEPRILPQTALSVTPLHTNYVFENHLIRLRLSFCTPLLPDDLALASRPVSYLTYQIDVLDQKDHEIEIILAASAEISVDTPNQTVTLSKTKYGCYCGRGNKNILGASGDNKRIDWGHFHLLSRDHSSFLYDQQNFLKLCSSCSEKFNDTKEMVVGSTCIIQDKFPFLVLTKKYKLTGQSVENFICLAYDDIHSIQYLDGSLLDAYYKKDGETFDSICQKALDEYESIKQRTHMFDSALINQANKISEQYADIVSLAYRQSFGAHKLTWDGQELQFFSKECFSNGCIGTVDITYPSIPLYLLYNPDLVCGMLNPVFRYAASSRWPFPYAPHDVGQYPIATGQVYGAQDGILQHDKQMPIEESGNMILCTAAVCFFKQDYSYAKQHIALLTQWAQYLKENGLDPENQLCTDDFAGHLAHNCNLSIKAIIGLASFGMICRELGDRLQAQEYFSIAKKYAKLWKEKAFDKDHYRLTFDQPGTWSIKYNIIWDKIFELNLFDSDIYETEIHYYMTRFHPYGLPLDSRNDYTKTDWQMWTLCMTDREEYKKEIICRMWNFLQDTPDRVPFSDWIYTSQPTQRGFQNRTVQGGLFAPLLLLKKS